MMKTILIPIDFSEASSKALEIGATIAKRISARIVLTHMVGINESRLSKETNFEDVLYYTKLTEKQYSKIVKEPFLEGLLIEPVLQKHLDFSSINVFAREVGASLIVMGSQGSTGFKEVFFGSNTEKVVRSSEIPLLVVKENELSFMPKRLIFTSDFDREAVKAYYKIIEIATLLGVKLEFLYVNVPGKKFQSTKEMDERILRFFNLVNHPDPVKAIKTVNRWADYSVEQGVFNFATLSGVDIIAIPTHGRTGISHFLNGSISEDIANHSTLPVLTVKI